MGKYSSDSDDKRASKSYKSRTKRRSSSSSSPDVKSHNRSLRRRSHSRDKHSRSRRSPSSSYKRTRRPVHKKSRSRDRHRRSRSKSSSRSNNYKVKSSRRRRSNSDSSSDEKKRKNNAESATKSSAEDVALLPDIKTLDEINDDSFVQKQFSSSGKSKKLLDNIVIDLKKNTIKMPDVEPVEPDSIFHHNLFLNEEARMEKWIKELYGFRQRALQQGHKHKA